VHRFLNDPHQGLGLPVADSFFPRGREPGQLALFLPDGRTPGPDARLILSALRSGLIDALHSWGDFNGSPPDPTALRSLAAACTSLLLAEGIRVQVWLNHGDACNHQNFPARLQDGYRGGDPASPWYTADVARWLGVKFAWCSELVSWPLSPHRPPLLRQWGRWGLNAVKNLVKLVLGRRDRQRRASSLIRLAEPVSLADGAVFMAFNRFNRHPGGLWGRPSRHTLRYSLAEAVLADLIRQEGFLIVYTHLGLPREVDGELFPPPDRRVLENLAAHYHQGRLWVAPTSRLLSFWLTSRHLVWDATLEGDHLVIHLVAVDDPTTGRRLPQPEELAGLCFYSPRPAATVLRLGGRDLSAVAYPPDHTGRESLGLPPPPPPGLDLEVA
jgi:hypothetical protein